MAGGQALDLVPKIYGHKQSPVRYIRQTPKPTLLVDGVRKQIRKEDKPEMTRRYCSLLRERVKTIAPLVIVHAML